MSGSLAGHSAGDKAYKKSEGRRCIVFKEPQSGDAGSGIAMAADLEISMIQQDV